MYILASLHRRWSILLVAAAAAAMIGCSETTGSPNDPSGEDPVLGLAPAPATLATFDGTEVRAWPFLAPDLENAHDPVSLLVTGEGDPRRIRAALMSVNGNRAGLPPPFDARTR